MSFRQVILKEGYPVISKENACKIRKLVTQISELSVNGDERGKFGMLAKKWQKYINAPFEISEKCCDVMKKKPFKNM